MFDIERYLSMAFYFLTGNIFISIGIGIVLLICIYKKPTETMKFLGFCALLVAVLYIMSLLTESGSLGVAEKKEGSAKIEKELMNQ